MKLKAIFIILKRHKWHKCRRPENGPLKSYLLRYSSVTILMPGQVRFQDFWAYALAQVRN